MKKHALLDFWMTTIAMIFLMLTYNNSGISLTYDHEVCESPTKWDVPSSGIRSKVYDQLGVGGLDQP